MTQHCEEMQQRTRSAFIWSRVLGVPFFGLISLLSIILYKDMHITPLQITVILSLKPMSGLLAPYWSQIVYKRPDLVIPNLVWANIIRYVPFLFIPWIESAWVIILFFGIYMILFHGAIPAWMETVKCHLPEQARERLVSLGSNIDYCGTAALPLLLAVIFDGYEYSWRWLFPLTATLGLASTWFIYRIPPPAVSHEDISDLPGIGVVFKEQVLKPWKQSWELIKENSGFAQFQIGFMLGGAGLLVLQPTLPIFFVDILHLSYTDILLALTLCKGVGFALASPFWVKLFRKVDIYYFSSLVTILAALFPLLILGAQSSLISLFIAYVFYGIMQSGSELSWHMSGPTFAQEKDSTSYSGVNVLTVGIRGCVAPALGATIYSFSNTTTVMLFSSFLCLLATRHLYRYSDSIKAPVIVE